MCRPAHSSVLSRRRRAEMNWALRAGPARLRPAAQCRLLPCRACPPQPPPSLPRTWSASSLAAAAPAGGSGRCRCGRVQLGRGVLVVCGFKCGVVCLRVCVNGGWRRIALPAVGYPTRSCRLLHSVRWWLSVVCLAGASPLLATLAGRLATPVPPARRQRDASAVPRARCLCLPQEVTVMFNLVNEPWPKYSLHAVADRGLRPHEWTSARLKSSVLYLESHKWAAARGGSAALANVGPNLLGRGHVAVDLRGACGAGGPALRAALPSPVALGPPAGSGLSWRTRRPATAARPTARLRQQQSGTASRAAAARCPRR